MIPSLFARINKKSFSIIALSFVSQTYAETLTWTEIAFRVLENNPSLKVQTLKPKITKEGISIAQSEFDPQLQAKLSHSQTDGDGSLSVNTPAPTSSDFTSEDQSTELSLGVAQKLELGTELNLNGSIIREDSDINSPNVNFKGKDDSNNLSLSIQQPLLKGRGDLIQTRRIRQADLSFDISKHQLAAYAEMILYQSLNHALDYYLNKEKIKLMDRALKLAKEEQKDIQLKIDNGLLAKTEIVAAEALVAQHQRDRTSFINAKEQTRLDLVHAMSPNGNDLWDYKFELAELSLPAWAKIKTQSQHIFHGLSHRHDLRQAELELESHQLDHIFHKNGLLPKLDFFAQIGYSDFDKRDAFNSIDTRGDGLQYQFGLLVEMPIFKRKEKAELRQNRFKQDLAEYSIRNLQSLIERDIRKAFISIQSFNSQIESARLNKKLRKQTLDIELDRQQQGISTSLQVQRAQLEYLDSQIDELEVKINEFRSHLLLFYRDGSLISRLNLEI